MTHGTLPHTTPWHKESFDRWLYTTLPQLLAARLPLRSYQATATSSYICRVTLALAGDVEAAFDLPQPDAMGVFVVADEPLVVVPTAANGDVATAQIRCVGEQLYDYVAERLGNAPAALHWDAALVRAWLPLNRWVASFLAGDNDARYRAAPLDTTNWLSRHVHLRRLYVLDRNDVATPDQLGRVCPFETPEGPNIGRIFTIALGAAIRDERLVVDDARAEAALGLSASVTPLLEHDDPMMLLMGTNMQRQWLPQANAEPALVQTGNEPTDPAFWCGRNLLTAFLSLGADTFEDALVLSESAAQRLGHPTAAESGDKLSNRHGVKGIVSKVLPDDQMPQLADGTPVELVCSFLAFHRLGFGQIREALVGRLAHAEGQPISAPPFHGPSADDLRQRLERAGLPPDGQEQLTINGSTLDQRSTVGWVYWGRLVHTAHSKLRVSIHQHGGQLQGELEYAALRSIDAFETVREQFHTRAAALDATEIESALEPYPAFGQQLASENTSSALEAQMRAEQIEHSAPPRAAWNNLAERLDAVGIALTLTQDAVEFGWHTPSAPLLTFSRPQPHPWLPTHGIKVVGARTDQLNYLPLVAANERLGRLINGDVPPPLIAQAENDLAARLRAYCDELVGPPNLRFTNRVMFSGRAVLAPDGELAIDQIALSEDLIWPLFAPLVWREIGEQAATRHDPRTVGALDAILARSWIIVNRAPSLTPTSFLAFHPVRRPERVIGLHPLACALLDTDFDGDQGAIFLPITASGQQEAAEKLSIVAHLARDHRLLSLLLPQHEAMWGIALLGQTPAGLKEIEGIVGASVKPSTGFVTRQTLERALKQRLAQDGPAPTIEAIRRLTQRGFAAIRQSGASLAPFVGEYLDLPEQPTDTDADAWRDYNEHTIETFFDRGYNDPTLRDLLMSIASGARGTAQQLVALLGARGIVHDATGTLVAVQHSQRDGLSAAELFAVAAGTRRAVAELHRRWDDEKQSVLAESYIEGDGIIARALRSSRPGIIFAHAAAMDGRDPLRDIDSRLFVGLAV